MFKVPVQLISNDNGTGFCIGVAAFFLTHERKGMSVSSKLQLATEQTGTPKQLIGGPLNRTVGYSKLVLLKTIMTYTT